MIQLFQEQMNEKIVYSFHCTSISHSSAAQSTEVQAYFTSQLLSNNKRILKRVLQHKFTFSMETSQQEDDSFLFEEDIFGGCEGTSYDLDTTRLQAWWCLHSTKELEEAKVNVFVLSFDKEGIKLDAIKETSLLGFPAEQCWRATNQQSGIALLWHEDLVWMEDKANSPMVKQPWRSISRCDCIATW